MNQIKLSVYHGDNLKIGYFNVIEEDVKIENNVSIGNNCTIYQNTKISDSAFLGSNIVIGASCLIGKDAEISSGSLIDDNVVVGQYAQISLGEKVLEDILPFATFKNGKIDGVNLKAIAENAKTFGIKDVEYIQAEAWRLIEYISTHPRSFTTNMKEEQKKAKQTSGGKLLLEICKFALSKRNGKFLAKAAPL